LLHRQTLARPRPSNRDAQHQDLETKSLREGEDQEYADEKGKAAVRLDKRVRTNNPEAKQIRSSSL
jgi:hypothetical protein